MGERVQGMGRRAWLAGLIALLAAGCIGSGAAFPMPDTFVQPRNTGLTVPARDCSAVSARGESLDRDSDEWVAGFRTALEVAAVRTLLADPEIAVRAGLTDESNPWELPADAVDLMSDQDWWDGWCDAEDLDRAQLTRVNELVFGESLLTADVETMIGPALAGVE